MTARSFVARFPGRCAAECGEPIEEGQQCVFVETDDLDAPATYAHLECQAEAAAMSVTGSRAPVQSTAVCPRCFLLLPLSGECGSCD